MQNRKGSIILALALIAAGALFLLQNLGVFGPFGDQVWAILFGVAGLVFLAVFALDREHWWALIPGFTLLGLAGLIAFGDQLDALGGTLFFIAIGLSFLIIYLFKRDFWWALIPAGVLLTLALVAALSNVLPGEVVGGIFFLGLGATFGLLYLLPTGEHRQKWAWIPGVVLAAMGLLMIIALGGWFNILWPFALIVGGGYLIYRALLARR